MKKQILKTAATKFLGKAAFVAILAAASLQSNAQDIQPKSLDPQIKYVGIVEDKLVFQFDYVTDGKETYRIDVQDAAGYNFYSNTCKDKSFQKRFAIGKDEAQNNAITFILSANGKEKRQTFEINATSRLVEEVNVVRAK